MLSREQIRRAQCQTLKVEAWDGEVLIRKLSASDAIELADHWGGEPLKGRAAVEAIAWVVSRGVVGDDFQPIFADATDAGQEPFEVLSKVSNAIVEFSGMQIPAPALDSFLG